MNEFKKILDTIKRPLNLEVKGGCKDQSVDGGLENYVSMWSDKARARSLNMSEMRVLSELNNLFENYSNLSPIERLNRIQDTTKLIDSPPEELILFTSQSKTDINSSENTPFLEPTTDSELQEVDIISDTEVSDDIGMLKFLGTSVQYVRGIGPRRAAILREVGVETLNDLLEYYPRDYLDRRNFKQIYQVGRSGDYETIQGKVVNIVDFLPQRRGAPKVCKFMVYDETAVAALVAFGKRGGYLQTLLKVGTELVVSGKFKRNYNEIQTTDFEYEMLSNEDVELIHTGRIVPKYPLTSKLNQRGIRNWIKTALDEYGDSIPEVLPLEIRQQLNLMDRRTAVKQIHFPDSHQLAQAARMRLAHDELFFLELGLALRKKLWELQEQGIAFKTDSILLDRFLFLLPFELTDAQKRVFKELRADMASPRPMNRLLQGDVGSGKTVVAAMLLTIAIDNGYQGALMAPTEILAEQHYHTLNSLLTPLGLNIILLKGDMPKREKDEAYESIKNGNAHIAVGTHALIQEGVEFNKLGFVIIDEQHRFGVMQRKTLRSKGVMPDVLVMTATPIPRTLALTVYGDLNVSTIDELPPGRQKVDTRWVPEDKRQEMYQFIEEQIEKGRQAYLVYPLVEESEKLEDIKAATEMAEHFQNDIFPHLKVGLIHGRMRSVEKQDIMQSFKNGEIHILVSTTVIEVGIDVPNASIMLIEHAERFGLAQLHQLRGRVGRSSHKSYCLLIADPKNEDALRRVKVMVRTNDGFKIAEEDLLIRGPGEFFGTRQAGMPDLKVADIEKDTQLLEQARAEAFKLMESDPALKDPKHQILKAVLKTKWQENFDMVSIG
ncbi:ATP-dependent DNA helicase RecG [Candidatus Poribacteria bacterium]|nr:ATP-dependent DNA helicase RecG [Candidatus Poribacteria bacterium]